MTETVDIKPVVSLADVAVADWQHGEKFSARIGSFGKLLGLEKAPNISIADGDEQNPTEYRGHPSSAQAKLAFITLDNLQIELIEPTGNAPSDWREFLERKGEGVHHVAFAVKGLGEGYLENYAKAGYPTVQHGGWETGEYGYMATAAALGVTLELIENYNRP